MEVSAFQYHTNSGWTVDAFPSLDTDKTLILVFASPSIFVNPAPIAQLADFYKLSKIVGCSTAGEIFGAGIYDNSLSVVLIKFEKTTIHIVKAEVSEIEHSFTAGKLIMEQLYTKDLHSIFVLSDGLNVNGSDLVEGLNSSNKKVIITGGLAGDSSSFIQTWTIFNGQILKNHIVAVGLYGDSIQVGYSSKGGWDIFGPARRITNSKGNILYELDNKPALNLYKEYLGDRAAELPASGLLYPLAIFDKDKHETPLVRTILGIDEDNQSLIFAGDMPNGFYARLMRANFDRLINSASEAGDMVRSEFLTNNQNKDQPIVSISISCVGRGLLLGQRIEEETESVLDSLPSATVQVGFYSYGELSPVAKGDCRLHNQTMTLTTITEKI